MWNNKKMDVQPQESIQELIPLSAYGEKIIQIIEGNLSPLMMRESLEDYHEKDIAEIMEHLKLPQRKKLYRVLDADFLAGVLEYLEDETAGRCLDEMDLKKISQVLEAMETDDAVGAMGHLSKDKRSLIMDTLSEETRSSISLTASFDEEEIGSLMTSNYILLEEGASVKEAMSSLVEQAAKNDNISTLFVADKEGVFAGAIDLKDLIIARQGEKLDDLIMNAFPYVYGQESVEDCLERLKGYSETLIPVLDTSNRMIGIITAQNVIEATDDVMGEDYAMLGGLTAEEDLKEPVRESLKKRLPWLFALLFLGLIVSSVVSAFERVVSQLTVIMAFQSLVLDMAGNVGTQSLAVTIRVLTSEGLTLGQKWKLLSKEIRVGLCNGMILGGFSVLLVGVFLYIFKQQTLLFSFAVSGCIGLALLLAMLASSASGTLIPMGFKKIGVDPAVASGPLITTINDLVAVVCYYGLSGFFLLGVLHLG